MNNKANEITQGKSKTILFYVFACLSITGWIVFVLSSTRDYWEDSYNYLLHLKAAINGDYHNFLFGQMDHPLFTYLLYTFGKLFGNAYIAAKSLSVVCYAVTLFYIFRLSQTIDGKRTGFFSLLLCTVVFIEYSVFSLAVLAGPLFTAILVAAVYYIITGRMLLSFTLFGFLPFVQSEYLIVIISVAAILLLQKKIRAIFLLGAINLPFALAWYFLFFSKHASIVKSAPHQMVARFGQLSVLGKVDVSLHRLSAFLLGGFSTGTVTLCFILGFAFFLLIKRARYRRTGEKPRKLDFQSPIFFISFFALSNLAGLVLLHILGWHPLADRHFGYLVPFIALLTARAVVYIEEQAALLLPEGMGRAKAVLPVLFLVLLTFNHPARLAFLLHYEDGNFATGKWLAGRLAEGEKIICPLPSVLFFSGYGLSDTVPYPKDLKDIDAYRSLRVKYVAWSGIYDWGNLQAREELKKLETGQDYLFFKSVYTPPVKKGWFANVYTLEGPSKGFVPSENGGWNDRPNLRVAFGQMKVNASECCKQVVTGK